MSYTTPAGTAANFSWVGAGAYTAPAGTAANFSWAGESIPQVTANGLGNLSVAGSGSVVHGETPAANGLGALALTGAGSAAHGVAGTAMGALVFGGAAAGAHGVAVAGAGAFSLAGGGTLLHPRYEVRGEVRDGGVLVNRSVRVYDLLTGELLALSDTAGGRFTIHTGFAPGLGYITPIDTGVDAADWLPPTANRVAFVLAQDSA